MSEMLDRHAAVIADYVRDGDMETARIVSRAALLAAFDSEDPVLALAIIRAVQGAMSATSVSDTVNRRVVSALRNLIAQGETAPKDPAPPQA